MYIDITPNSLYSRVGYDIIHDVSLSSLLFCVSTTTHSIKFRHLRDSRNHKLDIAARDACFFLDVLDQTHSPSTTKDVLRKLKL